MRWRGKREERASIPTASMADIAFLLIIFFMVTTIFRAEKGIKIELPYAMKTERLPKREVSRIWVSQRGEMSIDDKFVSLSEIATIMSNKAIDNPDMITQIKTDRRAKYGDVAYILEELKKARALRVSLATKEEE